MKIQTVSIDENIQTLAIEVIASFRHSLKVHFVVANLNFWATAIDISSHNFDKYLTHLNSKLISQFFQFEIYYNTTN